MTTCRKCYLSLVILAGLLAVTASTKAQTHYYFSFESDFQGWVADATDVSSGSTTAPWSIVRTSSAAKEGAYSLQLFLDNRTSAGKIWIERPFRVAPNRPYRVRVQYWFGSSDRGAINPWNILAGVGLRDPETRSDLRRQGYADNGGHSGFAWQLKTYTFEARSDSAGTLWVHLGVEGLSPFARRYHIDGVRVTFE